MISSTSNNNGTIIRKGKHVRKSSVICATQLAGGLLVKKLKYFEVMLCQLLFLFLRGLMKKKKVSYDVLLF